MKKTLIAVLFLTSTLTFIFAQKTSESSWKVLEQAQVCYDKGDYGEALRLSNEALNLHKNEFNYEYITLEKAITPKQVQRSGNEFVKVIPVLEERDETEAIQIINKYLNLYGRDFYSDNVQTMLQWIKDKNVYPEADYLIGKIYQVEGEYPTGYEFYKKALSEKSYLDIPEVQFDILYSMSDLLNLAGDTDGYEKTLLLILDSDEYFKNKTLLDSIVRTINQDRVQNVDRIFALYRAESKFTLKAINELSTIYENAGESKDSLKYCALGVIEAFTHIHNILSERDSTYSYSSLQNFLLECGKYPDVVEWGQKNDIWQMFFNFAGKAGRNGNLLFAQNFYIALSEAMPDQYYKKMAAEKIK